MKTIFEQRHTCHDCGRVLPVSSGIAGGVVISVPRPGRDPKDCKVLVCQDCADSRAIDVSEALAGSFGSHYIGRR